MVDPIEYVSYKIAVKAKEADPENTDDVDQIRYGVALDIGFYSVILLTVAIGMITKEFWGTLIGMGAFYYLRKFTGGFHFSSLFVCTIVSVAILSIIPHIHLSEFTVVSLTFICIPLIIFFSNKDTKTKAIASLIVLINFVFISPAAALAFFAQSLTLIKLRR
ncbi:accessory gene regulator B family protein [Paenibacillus elgii]|uniref:accessory gene regulator B family protein n=1 Tax=Paenibacillus elgii TaxID=189691 RepID=UPI0013D1093A|nr:accessory gene regulator B family protein [Paenibacillus elgii]